MKNLLILFCIAFTATKAQEITVYDSTGIVSKTITVDYCLSLPDLEDIIDRFPKKSFAITDFHYTTTLKGSVPMKGTVESYLGQKGKKQYIFKIFNPKPGMIIRIDRIHVIRKPGATGEIDIPPILEFILTE